MALITPDIKTERLLLREIKPGDIRYIFEGLSNPNITKYYAVSFSSLEETQSQMKFYKDILEQETGLWWAICSHDDKKFYGACGINNRNKFHKNAEVGYWLLPQFHGKGFVNEALRGICAHCF